MNGDKAGRFIRWFAVLGIAGSTVAAAQIPPPATARTGELRLASVPAPSLAKSVYPMAPEQPAAVYLPPAYASGEGRFPVLYFLAGFGDQPQMYTEWRYYQGFSLKDSMDELILGGKVPEMIVVIPNGMTFLGGSFYVNSPVDGNWEDFVAADLVGYVDANFRTIRSPGARAIAGHSMGGFGALNLSMHRVDVFGAVYALSPGLAAPGSLQNQRPWQPRTAKLVLEAGPSFSGLPPCEAKLAFVASAHHLLMAGDFSTLFAFAYGAAFAPDPSGPPPYILFPFRMVNGTPILDPGIWKRYEEGFGNLAEKVDRAKPSLAKLRLIAIDVGAKDEEAWIPPGCEYFAKLLTGAGIPCRLVRHEGGHQDRLRERLEQHLLPEIGAVLTRK